MKQRRVYIPSRKELAETLYLSYMHHQGGKTKNLKCFRKLLKKWHLKSLYKMWYRSGFNYKYTPVLNFHKGRASLSILGFAVGSIRVYRKGHKNPSFIYLSLNEAYTDNPGQLKKNKTSCCKAKYDKNLIWK